MKMSMNFMLIVPLMVDNIHCASSIRWAILSNLISNYLLIFKN